MNRTEHYVEGKLNLEGCVFCEIYKDMKERRKNFPYENEYFFARFDRYPVSPGHLEVISKRHIVSLQDLKMREWDMLQDAISGALKIVMKNHLGGLEAMYKYFIEHPVDQKSAEFSQRMLKHPGLHMEPDGYNLGINEGRAAGRTIDHLNIHIIPRYLGDVEDYVGGIRNIIPGMGDYKKN